MTFIKTTASYVLAIILAQIPTYFIQRYFFKNVMDKSLDKFEGKMKNIFKKKGDINVKMHNV